ncbi:protein kinase [Pseudenhygromyxa sp. WMMC2535]|uniref:protein kinase domain-containing protein n=1 Tax=Pseudenhygromyxa sp. WMMC2535 TaxID=2712867 RepID=UPI0015578587|nr:protein kinase [Pseudenhygromyxa sp. WMMC2535]NVB38401.1 protein kinase [Pseudenhygromyxa sp. WMMC2535]
MVSGGQPSERIGFAATEAFGPGALPNPERDEQPEPPAEELCGALIAGRYRLVSQLGSGGMGSVYLATDLESKRRFAVKIYRASLPGRGSEHADRLAREARMISMLEHENIVEIFASGMHDESLPYFVMECLDGEDLGATIRREGPLAWSRARPMLLQILSALAHAHAQGVIHRDVKPQNCFRLLRRGNRDFIKVLDFGLAKSIDSRLADDAITRTGVVLGTVQYMSPEQARGEQVGVASDLYSVGVLAYELLTGVRPFDGRTPTAVLARLLTEDPPKMAEVAPDQPVDPRVEALIARALSKDPQQRYASADEFIAQIEKLPADLARTRARGRRARLRVGAAVFGLGLVCAGVLFLRERAYGELIDGSQAALEVDAELEGEALYPAAHAPNARVSGSVDSATETAAKTAVAASDRPGSEDEAEPLPRGRTRARAAVPEQLRERDMRSTLAAAGKRSRACGGGFDDWARVEIDVAPDGKVTRAKTLSSLGGSQLGNCAERAIRGQRFPASRSGLRRYTIALPLTANAR